MNQFINELDDNLLEVIQRLLPDLRKSDRKVADIILASPETTVDYTLGKLAEIAQVSEPTVVRFCVAIGCEGFRDMRTKLARSLAFSRSTSHAEISSDDELDAIVTKIFDFNLSNLNWARNRINLDEIHSATDILSKATSIEFFGFGASGIVARDAQQKFPLFGVPCGAPVDGHQMHMTASMANAGQTIVAISNTGMTAEVIEATKIARENGAKTIGILGSKGKLAQYCDCTIIVESIENTDIYTPTVSRLAALVIIDILSTAVSLQRGDAHAARIAEMKSKLSQLKSE